ncbi:hypothetical protein IIA16_02920 [bacterium]|nr:hypothetical protein [bacterium]
MADTSSVVRLATAKAPLLPFQAGYEEVLFPDCNLGEGKYAPINVQGTVRKWEATQGWTITPLYLPERESARQLLEDMDEGEACCMAICQHRSAALLTDDYEAIRAMSAATPLHPHLARVVTTASLLALSLQNQSLTADKADVVIGLIRESGAKLMTVGLVEVCGKEDLI